MALYAVYVLVPSVFEGDYLQAEIWLIVKIKLPIKKNLHLGTPKQCKLSESRSQVCYYLNECQKRGARNARNSQEQPHP